MTSLKCFVNQLNQLKSKVFYSWTFHLSTLTNIFHVKSWDIRVLRWKYFFNKLTMWLHLQYFRIAFLTFCVLLNQKFWHLCKSEDAFMSEDKFTFRLQKCSRFKWFCFCLNTFVNIKIPHVDNIGVDLQHSSISLSTIDSFHHGNIFFLWLRFDSIRQQYEKSLTGNYWLLNLILKHQIV